MLKRWWIPPLVLLGASALLWPWRHALRAESIAAWSPEQAALSAVILLALYMVKGLSLVVPLSALEAAGGLLFPLPTALLVNLLGVFLTQTAPYLLGRRQQENLDTLTARYPRLAPLTRHTSQPGRTVFLLRLGGASPGDLVSFFLGAAGISWRAYLLPSLLGTFPRMAAATVLGSALWDIGGRRFWLSLGTGALLTGLSLLLWQLGRRTS